MLLYTIKLWLFHSKGNVSVLKVKKGKCKFSETKISQNCVCDTQPIYSSLLGEIQERLSFLVLGELYKHHYIYISKGYKSVYILRTEAEQSNKYL